MESKNFSIYISSTKSGVEGTLKFNDIETTFNPLTVLNDLLIFALDYHEFLDEKDDDLKSNVRVSDQYTFKTGYEKHPFFQDECYQRGAIIYEQNRKQNKICDPNDSFDKIVTDIHHLLFALYEFHQLLKRDKKVNISMSQFDLMKSLNLIQFSYRIESRYENPYKRDVGSSYKKFKAWGKLHILEEKGFNMTDDYRYLENDFAYGVDMDVVQDILNDEKHPSRFAYTCHTLTEVFFAIWHYLIFHNYTKFNQCKHCGRYFATSNLRQKYCENMSPYQNFTHLDCEQAVRNILQKCSRKKKKIYDKLYRYGSDETLDQFFSVYEKQREIVKHHASVQNLESLEKLLSTYES